MNHFTYENEFSFFFSKRIWNPSQKHFKNEKEKLSMKETKKQREERGKIVKPDLTIERINV